MKRGFSNADNRVTPPSRPAETLKTGDQSWIEPIHEILSQVKDQ